MEIVVEDVFFIREAGLASFAVSVGQPGYELKEGWYYLRIRGIPVEKLWIEGEDFLSPSNARFRSLSTRDFDKVVAHAFGEHAWTLEPLE